MGGRANRSWKSAPQVAEQFGAGVFACSEKEWLDGSLSTSVLVLPALSHLSGLVAASATSSTLCSSSSLVLVFLH